MFNILVLYDSATGHTRKMAEYVAKGAAANKSAEVRLKFVDEASRNDILWADGIAVGSPTNLGIVSWKMKKFWDDLCDDLWGKIDGKIGCAFSSEGGLGGGAELACMSILTMLINYGFLVFGATDYVADKFTLHYGPTIPGEPRTENEIAACMRIGEKLAHWVEIYNNKH